MKSPNAVHSRGHFSGSRVSLSKDSDGAVGRGT